MTATARRQEEVSFYVALAILLAAATGCGGSDPTKQGEDAPARTALDAECVDRVRGFSVEYPAGWHVDSSGVLPPCSLFHPGPFEVPVDSEVPIDIAVMLSFEAVPFERMLEEDFGRRDISREEVRIGGHEAVRIDAETTGEGLYDRGIRFYQYLVDLGDSSMLAVTYDAGPVPFAEKRRVLDSMMTSLQFGSTAVPE